MNKELIKHIKEFIKVRYNQIENDERDSIDFKNGYYLATKEIYELLDKFALHENTGVKK